MLNVYPDNFSTNLILPLDHERTLTVFEWFFPDPEKPQTREAVRSTVEFSDEIRLQDIAICEAVQTLVQEPGVATARASQEDSQGF